MGGTTVNDPATAVTDVLDRYRFTGSPAPTTCCWRRSIPGWWGGASIASIGSLLR